MVLDTSVEVVDYGETQTLRMGVVRHSAFVNKYKVN